MSILRSTYLEELPDRDRWGTIEDQRDIALHVAVSGWDVIHLQLEENDGTNAIEVNLTVEDALKVHAGLTEAIIGAMKGRKK